MTTTQRLHTREDLITPAPGKVPTRRFGAITGPECVGLLESHSIGRVAWQAADGPQILPVTYVYQSDRIYFRTSPHGVLSELLRPTDVAFEVDDLNHDTRTGSSVVVYGRAEAVASPAEAMRIWTTDLAPWAPDIRNLFIQITPHRTTGRLLTRDPEDY